MINDRIGAVAQRMSQIGIGGVGGDTGSRTIPAIQKPDGPSFGETLTKAINEVSAAQDTSADYTQKFLRGEPVELHQVMAATEEAGLALDMLIELRNKLTEAYRTVVSMQS